MKPHCCSIMKICMNKALGGWMWLILLLTCMFHLTQNFVFCNLYICLKIFQMWQFTNFFIPPFLILSYIVYILECPFFSSWRSFLMRSLINFIKYYSTTIVKVKYLSVPKTRKVFLLTFDHLMDIEVFLLPREVLIFID